MWRFFLFVFLILFHLPAYAAGNTHCNPKIIEVREPANVHYDPFDSRPRTEIVRVILQNTASIACKGRLVFFSAGERKLSSSTNGRFLDYDLQSQAGQEIGKDHNSSNAIRFNIPANTKRFEVKADMVIPAQQYVSSGHYRQNIEARIFEEASSTQAFNNTYDFALSAYIYPQAGISLAGSAGAHYSHGKRNAVMDFGTLKRGDKKSIFVKVRANQPYKMVFTSENNGQMRNLDVSGHFIKYRADLDGKGLNFFSGSQDIVKKRITDSRGDSHKLSVNIGNTSEKAAGRYQDIITIDVFPLEY
ncbi:MAG: hypothetical protein ACLFRA_03980 [Alphaproteobacteria bacterium]